MPPPHARSGPSSRGVPWRRLGLLVVTLALWSGSVVILVHRTGPVMTGDWELAAPRASLAMDGRSTVAAPTPGLPADLRSAPAAVAVPALVLLLASTAGLIELAHRVSR